MSMGGGCDVYLNLTAAFLREIIAGYQHLRARTLYPKVSGDRWPAGNHLTGRMQLGAQSAHNLTAQRPHEQVLGTSARMTLITVE